METPQLENGYIRIATELFEALLKIRIPGEARQMFDAILRKTYGYQKKEDKISTTQFMEMTGLPKRSIHQVRQKLVKMNIITIHKKEYSQVLNYSIQKDYTKWKPYIKNSTVHKKSTNSTYKSVQTVHKKKTDYKYNRYKDNIQKIPQVDFIPTLKTIPAYSHINIDTELGKMDAWLLAHPGRQKTKKFVVNWLNKIEKPLEIKKPNTEFIKQKEAKERKKFTDMEKEAALVNPAEVKALLNEVRSKIGKVSLTNRG